MAHLMVDPSLADARNSSGERHQVLCIPVGAVRNQKELRRVQIRCHSISTLAALNRSRKLVADVLKVAGFPYPAIGVVIDAPAPMQQSLKAADHLAAHALDIGGEFGFASGSLIILKLVSFIIVDREGMNKEVVRERLT